MNEKPRIGEADVLASDAEDGARGRCVGDALYAEVGGGNLGRPSGGATRAKALVRRRGLCTAPRRERRTPLLALFQRDPFESDHPTLEAVNGKYRVLQGSCGKTLLHYVCLLNLSRTTLIKRLTDTRSGLNRPDRHRRRARRSRQPAPPPTPRWPTPMRALADPASSSRFPVHLHAWELGFR